MQQEPNKPDAPKEPDPKAPPPGTEPPRTDDEIQAAHNRLMAKAMGISARHKKTLLALLGVAPMLALAAPGRVADEPAQLTDVASMKLPNR